MNHSCRTPAVYPRTLGAACLCATLFSSVLTLLFAAGCETPVAIDTNRSLRNSAIATARRETADAQSQPAIRTTDREDQLNDMGLKPELMPELEKMAGPKAYVSGELPPDTDLLGQPIRTRKVSLERAVTTAATNNLAVQFSRLAPAVTEAQLVNAQAAFDWVFFSNLNWNNTDSPRSSTLGAATPIKQQTTQWNTGLRRPLTTGGQITVQQELNYLDDTTRNSSVRPNPNSLVGVTLQIDQPLLRGAGSDVALAETRIARNAERSSIATLRRDLIRNITDTEKAYWQLFNATRTVQILKQLLDRGTLTASQVKGRIDLDATPSQIADSIARVERRRADLLRAQSALLQASDRLKVLMNDPEIPVGSEIVLLPADQAIDAPLQFSLLDLIETSITDRPEIEQAILSIDDTATRKLVADNARLPRLDLRLQTRFNSLGGNPGPVYSDALDGSFVDYLVGLVFEQPIGNRRAESEYRRRNIERAQAVLSYRNTVQQVIGEVKNSLRSVTLNYKLITQTRDSRLAASDVLRSLLVEKQLTKSYTVERLDLELNRQESLASAEREEVQAVVDYNSAVADLYAAIGRTLTRNKIDFNVQPVPAEYVPFAPRTANNQAYPNQSGPSEPATPDPNTINQ